MVKYIPDMLTFPFTMWMIDNGFHPTHKKGFIVMKRGNEVLRISMKIETEKGFEMNEACRKKFLSFCKAYLNRDKSFLDQLRIRGVSQITRFGYQKVAA
ncbi:hypothetical protein [Acinetobacter beijerinckii]|uniref:hypothetical protein n=1 Tax=Acinetobacter beijerinckii TaxID=262668 RepID=UPI003AF6FD23